MMTSDEIKAGDFVVMDTDMFYYAMLILKKYEDREFFDVISARRGLGTVSYQMMDIRGEIRTDKLDELKQIILKTAFTGKKWK